MSSFRHYLTLCLLLALPIGLAVMPVRWVEGDEYSFCLWRHLFDTPCYGCGMTRAVVSALHFEFAKAWAYNHLVVVVLPLLFYLWGDMVFRVVRKIRKVS